MIEDGYIANRGKHYEGAMTQGNSYVHLRAVHEEGLVAAPQDGEYMRMPANVTVEKPRHPISQCCMCIPGISGRHPLLNEEMVNLPNPLRILLCMNGEQLDMDDCEIVQYHRTLDMSDGLLTRSFVWQGKDGTHLQCRYERFVSMANPHLILQRTIYTSVQGQPELLVRCGIDDQVRTNGFNHFAQLNKHADADAVEVTLTTDQGDSVYMRSHATSTAGMWHTDGSDQCLSHTLSVGESLTIEKQTSLSTSRDLPVATSCNATDWDILLIQQQSLWEQLWLNARILIEGDDKAQFAVDFSVYHLLRCSREQDDRVAICAKGFSSDAYFGHFFWDTELYLLPFYLYTSPKCGQNLARFRIQTLSGAVKNAAAYGYHGARYPWESSVSGDEQCPNWQYADHEIHVTADVALGLWHTYCALQDETFLRDAAPVFLQTARYWLERMSEEPDGSLSLKGVMGPDEYICLCNNNAYTNYLVRYALERTLDVMDILSLRSDALQSDIRNALGRLRCQAEGEGIIPQCDGFEHYDEPHFNTFWPDRSKRYGATVSQERNYRTKSLKQADVLMLPYLFPSLWSSEQLAENLDYYLPLTTHDSSLSAVIHAILLCRLGRIDEAFTFFEKAIETDLTGEGAAEGVHIANCGGIWQAIVLGFAGMNFAYESDFPSFSPKLPTHWKRLSFSLSYLAQIIRVDMSADGVVVGQGEHHA